MRTVQTNEGTYLVIDEAPAGTIDGSNKTFYLKYKPISGTLAIKAYWRDLEDMRAFLNGDITSSSTGNMLGIAKNPATLRAIAIALRETGADGANPLSVVVDVKKNGTSIFDAGTTKPTLSKADSDYDVNRVVLGSADDKALAADDVLTFDTTVTRTTPTTEIAGLMVQAEMLPEGEYKREGSAQDYVVDEKNRKITFNVAPPAGCEIVVTYEHYGV
jgi:hypothetical protein